LVYLGKELILATAKDAGDDAGKKMRVLEGKLDEFLEGSDYERVEGVAKILSL
jgi:hypothetical protein